LQKHNILEPKTQKNADNMPHLAWPICHASLQSCIKWLLKSSRLNYTEFGQGTGHRPIISVLRILTWFGHAALFRNNGNTMATVVENGDHIWILHLKKVFNFDRPGALLALQ